MAGKALVAISNAAAAIGRMSTRDWVNLGDMIASHRLSTQTTGEGSTLSSPELVICPRRCYPDAWSCVSVRGEPLAKLDDILDTIEVVHAAGLEEERWTDALSAVARLLDSNCATLEVVAIPALKHREFRGFNVPEASELLYLRDFVALNPRIPFAARRRTGELVCDYQFLDEAAIERDPFYAGFLAKVGVRYFVAAILERSDQKMVTISVHRSHREGHIEEGGLTALRRLLPHLRQAYDVTDRLRAARSGVNMFQSALDWLSDGVMLVSDDRSILFVNDAALAILRRRDGIRTSHGRLEFDSASVCAEFDAGLGRISRLREGLAAEAAADIALRRKAAPPYLISIRPLPRALASMGAAIVFIRDPLRPFASQYSTLRAALGLTEAEAALAEAMQAGMAPAVYARKNLISPNTVYTHLRRIKDKAGCRRMSELIRRLNDLRLPLRTD
jgi:DNA-binding CsgD family transcriptional regulator